MRQDIASTIEALNQGTAVPINDPAELEHMWHVLRDIRACAGMSNVGLVMDSIAHEFSEDTNPIVLIVRNTIIQDLLDKGLLVDWLEGGEVKATVFYVASKWPLTLTAELDEQAFIDQLARENDRLM